MCGGEEDEFPNHTQERRRIVVSKKCENDRDYYDLRVVRLFGGTGITTKLRKRKLDGKRSGNANFQLRSQVVFAQDSLGTHWL